MLMCVVQLKILVDSLCDCWRMREKLILIFFN
jgi:hypothetical protein